MDPYLLDYSFSTSPIPLQVNAPGARATSRINVSVSNPNPGGLFCSDITVMVAVGTGATDFCVEPPTASVSTGKWTVATLDLVKGEEVGLPQAVYAKIVFQCRDKSDYGLGYSLVLSLVGIVNSTAGAFTYNVLETSGPSPDTMTTRSGTHTISKQDAVFTLSDFVATTADQPTVPGTAFANGQPLRLSWQSTGTWFELYAKGSPAPLYAGPATSCGLDAGLSADTQFVLVASVTGDPSGDSPSPGYQAIYLYDALTLVVTNPDLTPRTVNAQNGIATAGTLNVGGQSTLGPVNATGAMNVAGLVTVSSVSVKGRSELLGELSVGTDAVPADVRVHGAVTAGPASVKDLTVNGTATVDGAATVTGALDVSGQTRAREAVRVDSTLQVLGSTVLASASASVLTAGNVTIGVPTPERAAPVLEVQGPMRVDTGDNVGLQTMVASPTQASGFFQNTRPRLTDKYSTGIVSVVELKTDWGLTTDGRIASMGGMAPLTHVPTRGGNRFFTSPVTTVAYLLVSGWSRIG
jgi:hypothetical protein